jgi:hypothetical protein
MNFEQAIKAATPFITEANAAAYALETDKMIWVEDYIMSSAGIDASICSPFGERVCVWIEEALDTVTQHAEMVYSMKAEAEARRAYYAASHARACALGDGSATQAQHDELIALKATWKAIKGA